MQKPMEDFYLKLLFPPESCLPIIHLSGEQITLDLDPEIIKQKCVHVHMTFLHEKSGEKPGFSS